MEKKFDFLVIGSGIAGLSYALKVAEYGKVCILTKSSILETNTNYAQGGIAAVMKEPDSIEKHISDTLKCGNGLCNEEIVRMVATEGPHCVKELISLGAKFDEMKAGDFNLAKEGGHTEHRILHHKDHTGNEIQKVLTEKVRSHKNIEILEHHFTIDLITQHHLGKKISRTTEGIECYGAYVLNINTNNIFTVLAKITLMAAGGNGNIYETTTNPSIATGDGIAMVYRAKGTIENVEFVQFHPTSLYNPGERPSFLITEALRGFGAILKSIDGEEFMGKYDKRESLASRDIVARAIDNEMKLKGDDFVYLDCSHLNNEELKENFPNIYKKCFELGIDICKEPIPVVPAAHYMCGGIKIDEFGRTSIKNLYAAGENSSSGLHGSNRLASNSLTEAVVFADRAAKDSIKYLMDIELKENIPPWNDEGTSLTEEMVLITQTMKELQQIMTYYVGIVRSDLRLNRAFDRLSLIYRETDRLYRRSKICIELCELRNAINNSYLIIKMAKRRKESIGLHYTMDYPEKNSVMR
ncbi:L-aspartate oxidase [Bacteroidota bacterium]